MKDAPMDVQKKLNYHISIDDYHEDNYKVAGILLKYGLKATFFIELEHEGDRRYPLEQVKILSDMGFEIGCHTITHPILSKVNEFEMDLNIFYAQGLIEEKIGKKIDWFAPPKGKYNQEVVDKVFFAGFKYFRTTAVLNTKNIKEGIVATSIHMYQRKEYKKSWLETARDLLIDNNMECMKLWGHTFELHKYNYWKDFENFLVELKQYV